MATKTDVERAWNDYQATLNQYGPDHPQTRAARDRVTAVNTAYENRDYRDAGVRQAEAGRGGRPTGGRYTTQGAPNSSATETGTATDPRINRLLRTWVAQNRVTQQEAAALERRAQDDVIAFLSDVMSQYGMGDMTGVITDLARQGYSQAEITLRLRETEQYKQTFGYVNDARRKAGYSALSELEIVSLRDAYRGMLRDSGLPKGFYDSRDDFDKFLTNDISVNELGQRIAAAQQVVGERVDEATQQAFKRYFGIDKKGLAAYFLDPERATPLLQKQADMALIGGEGLSSDVKGLANKGFVENLVDKGVTQAGARQAFGMVAEQQDTVELLGDIEGTRVSTRDQAEAVLGLDNNADKKVRGMKSRERARFSGSAGGTRVLGSDTAGSY